MSVSASGSLEDRVQYESFHYLILAAASTISGTLSILGSACIIVMARKKLKHPYHFIMLGLSVADIIFSTSLISQPFLTPSDQFFSIGSQATCNTVGFVFHVSATAGAIQNFVLSYYFVLTIRQGWKLDKVQNSFLRPVLIPTILIPFAFGVLGLVTRSFNPAAFNLLCNIESSPAICGDNIEIDGVEQDIPCERGEHATILFRAQILVILVVSVAGFIGTGLVYFKVRSTMLRNNRHDFSRSLELSTHIDDQQQQQQSQRRRKEARNKRLQSVGAQAILYSLAYFNQLAWPLTTLLLRTIFAQSLTTGSATAISFISLLFYPLQGFLNFFVYIRPEYTRQKSRYPHASMSALLCHIVFGGSNEQSQMFQSSTLAKSSNGGLGSNNKVTTSNSQQQQEQQNQNSDNETCDRNDMTEEEIGDSCANTRSIPQHEENHYVNYGSNEDNDDDDDAMSCSSHMESNYYGN